MAKKADEMTSVRKAKHGMVYTVLFAICSVIWIAPILIVILNSFKRKAYIFRNPFGISTHSITEGWDKFVRGIQKAMCGGLNYSNAIKKTDFFQAFGYSLLITVLSVILIIICTSMCAWYITRLHNRVTKAIYVLCLFSMIVPFQMVMFT